MPKTVKYSPDLVSLRPYVFHVPTMAELDAEIVQAKMDKDIAASPSVELATFGGVHYATKENPNPSKVYRPTIIPPKEIAPYGGNKFVTSDLTVASNYYVSNAAVNGYGLGVDSGSTSTKLAPFLTINYAITKCSNGDTIYVNGTSSTKTSANHPYVENSGSGFLQCSVSVTIQRDPTQTDSNGFVVIQPVANTTRVMSCGLDSGSGQTFSDLWFDNLVGSSGLTAITAHASAALTFIRCGGLNISSSGIFIGGTGSTSTPVVLDRCINDASCLGGYILWNGSNLTVKGGTFPMTGGQKIISAGGNGLTMGSFTMQAASDNSRCVFSGNGIPFYLFGGTYTNFNCSYFDFNNTQRGFAFSLGTDAAAAITGTFTFSNFTVTYGANSTNAWFPGVLTENFTVNPTLHDFTITEPRTDGTSLACIQMSNFIGTPVIYNGTINNAGQQYACLIGNDGLATNTFNTATTTGYQNLGDVSGNTYVDQFFTTPAITAQSPNYAGTVVLNMKKISSPTGTIACALYTDSAGNPGSLIEAADATLSASVLTSSPLPYQFNFASRTHIAAGTKIHVRLFYSGGTGIDGTDYIQIQENTTTTNGSILKSANGSSWTADTSHSLMYYYSTGSYGLTDPVFRNNVVYGTQPTTQQHGCIFGTTVRGQQYRNQYYGTVITNIFKFCKASSSSRGLCWANLVSTNATGANPYLAAAKASQYVDYLNNTLVVYGTCTAQMVQVPDNTPYFGSASVNAQLCDNVRFMNNIVINGSTTGTSPVFALTANGLNNTATNVTINYNDVWTLHSNPIGIVGSTTYSTWTTWQGANYDLNSINTDPLLFNEAAPAASTDFVPGITSPSLKLGTNTNGAVPTDYNGVAFGLTPDAGSFNILATTAANANPPNTFNPLPNAFNWKSPSPATIAATYMLLPQVGSFSANATAVSSPVVQTILMNATSGALTATLPSAVVGTQVTVTKTDSSGNAVTVATVSGQTITSVAGSVATTYSLATQGKSVTLTSNGTNWVVTASI